MKNPPSPELFVERPIQSTRARRGPSYAVRRLISVSVALLAIGGGLYWAFGNMPPSVPDEIPTIKAEGSYKQRPQQPGGIDIPHQDVQVYQALDAHGPPGIVVEHLLPPPETPQPRPTAAPQQNAPSTPQAEFMSLAAPKPEVPKAVLVPAPVMAAQSPAPPLPDKTPSVQTATVPAAEASPKTIDEILEKNAPTAQSNSILQLASLPDEAAARTAMDTLRTKYAEILGATPLHIVRADLGQKGIYYRVQSHPIPVARTQEICARLKNLKAGCLIVRP